MPNSFAWLGSWLLAIPKAPRSKCWFRLPTRRTELQERFPDHVVNRWMGHSGKVAEKHYLQVTEEHWGEASRFGSHTGSHITSHPEPISKNHKTKKPSVLLGLYGSGCVENTYLVTPTGVEPVLPP